MCVSAQAEVKDSLGELVLSCHMVLVTELRLLDLVARVCICWAILLTELIASRSWRDNAWWRMYGEAKLLTPWPLRSRERKRKGTGSHNLSWGHTPETLTSLTRLHPQFPLLYTSVPQTEDPIQLWQASPLAWTVVSSVMMWWCFIP